VTLPRADFSLVDTYGLAGRVVLVTSATDDIGAGIAWRVAEAGAAVVAQHHGDELRATALIQALQDAGYPGIAVEADLTTREACHELMLAGARKYEHVDCLVNTATLEASHKFTDIDVADWNAVMQKNLSAPFYLQQAFAAHRRIGGFTGGAIVNIGAVMGQQSAVGRAHCTTATSALQTLTRAAALELGKAGIRVNSVSPGLIDATNGVMDCGIAQRWATVAPLQRLGRVDDIANAVLYLLSDASRWMTGTDLVVDGGVSCSPRW